jgi:AraC family transcriptional regulator, transcriptional activator of pobA
MTDEQIIQAYKTAFQKVSKDGVIDLDKRMKHQWRYHIYRLEKLLPELTTTIPPFRQSNFFINYIRQGTGNRTIGHYRFPLQDKTLSISPQRVIQSSFVSPESRGYVLLFNLDFFLQQGFPYHFLHKKKILKTSVRPYAVLNDEQDKEVVKLFESILHEHESRLPGNEEMIALKILALLILCDRFFVENGEQSGTPVYDETMNAFSNLIEKNLSKRRPVQWYAKELHVHPNHLNYIVKKITGLTAKVTIDNRLVLEAKYLLASSKLSIKEIAHDLGFENPDYFMTFFKKNAGVSPGSYREMPV